MSRTVAPLTAAPRIQPSALVAVLKPVTWFAPVWAFACGGISALESLGPDTDHLIVLRDVLLGLVLAGPMLCGASQAVNDWFDRHVDAINEPDRPIPSGRLPGRSGLTIAILWTAASLLLASFLGPIVFTAAAVGCAFSWAYSAPPLRLKKNGWYGNASVAISYEGLAWVTGAALVAQGMPSLQSLFLALLYSLGAHGIMTLNDFKSIQGDLRFGIRTLPARYGVKAASWIACVVMAGAQIAVMACLVAWGHTVAALLVSALLFGQVGLMKRFLADPQAEAIRYNATGTGLYVLGMMVAAVALGVS
ncbi:Bacteriochlorophyll/chlorophyll synthetase [Fulvimarina pelagi HTCC2506]|uniref:Bacteriochlorophyll/chlorophyll synthetase n=1 Tax=Fulvimarina pelagi HTCC2506 TaxID=314231 RepID=Q0FYR1_9HYPH|nr:chlorophyll synthase ChlG [Fulvimarina pelagi]EAU40247.1 Bacteriochlorophyll/chlorophyll synthetase [Fulvimarina pelagi HTCC2506]